jgi:hypothetical protein
MAWYSVKAQGQVYLYLYLLQVGRAIYEGVSKSFRTESIMKYMLNNNKHSLRSNTKGYGDRTHWNDSQKSDTTASSGRELYHLQFSLVAASPETSGYILVILSWILYEEKNSCHKWDRQQNVFRILQWNTEGEKERNEQRKERTWIERMQRRKQLEKKVN